VASDLHIDPSSVDAVVLDAGGVLILPTHELVGEALREVEVEHHEHDEAFRRAHYVGMHAYDRSTDAPEVWDDYVTGYLSELGVAAPQTERATRALLRAFSRPTTELWIWAIAETCAALERLGAAGMPLAVVSNADGVVEQALAIAGVCQVGPGEGIDMVTIVDSTKVGATKPDPAIFPHALEVLGVAAQRCVYVGDSVRNDVMGARAAGLQPLLLDPFDLHEGAGHDRVKDLSVLVEHLLGI